MCGSPACTDDMHLLVVVVGPEPALFKEAIEASGVIPSLNNYYPDRYKLVNGVHVVVLHDLQIKPLTWLYACTITHCAYKCSKTSSLRTHIASTSKLDR